MTKTKGLTIAVVVLALLNVVLLAGLYFGKPPHGQSPRDLIIERLDFDATQIMAYDSLIQEHRAAVQEQEQLVLVARENLYVNLQGTGETLEKEAFLELKELSSGIELIHYHHFQSIKILCDENQTEQFNVLTAELPSLFVKKPPK